MSKYLVTGGAGFVGSNLVKKLVDDGHNVTVIDDFSIGNVKVGGAFYVEADIEHINVLNDADFDVCFHLAGKSRIQPSFSDPIETLRVNVMGTVSVMQYANRNGIKVVYSGSSSRHHNPKLSPYAESKWQGEEVCKMYQHVYNADVSIVRFYNVYGPGEIIDGDWAAVIGKWKGNISRKKPIQIVGDGEQRRDFTHVDDIVDGLILASEHEPHEDAWEFGNGENYSINEVAEMFRERFGDIDVEYVEDQPGNYRATLRENMDAIDYLGWSPTKSLRDYIIGL